MPPLGQAATPRLARFHTSGDVRGYRALSIKMAALGAVLGAAGLIVTATIGSFLITLVYRPEYAQRGSLFTVAMAAAGLGFVASLLGYVITAARRFREQMPLQAACLIATLIGAYVLVPRIGLTGAAIAVGIGSAVQIAAEAWIWLGVLASMRKAGAV